MRTEFDRVHVTKQGAVAVLTLNHPESLNAASVSMVHGAMKALSHIEHADSGYRAIVVTGEGRGFCSGANLAEAAERRSSPETAGDALETAYHPLLRRFRDCRLPIVTAVNGAAAGIGMSIALMGDIIVAARSAYFLQAFARVGLVPDGGSTWMLPRMIGLARARELSLLAEKLPAETALAWGLINRVFDDATMMEEALKLATRLAEGPASLGMVRRLYWESPHNSFEQQIEQERMAQGRAGRSADFMEGVGAFLQKRPAKFTGK
ncbi:MAG: enoyl-CoA hydratase/isomerase [Alphaproteobacteria bacterium]|nr:enoyl-CoA hydratase/isomerase [Alphaproteobacteria bacterium]MBV9692780.1 enoyl-CoA hydratase/isomerase [Alphaproteobacteria bacterium]